MNNDLIALQAYIDNMNAEHDARMRKFGATFWTSFALTAEEMFKEYKVGTIDQFKDWLREIDEQEARKESYYESDYDQALIDAKEDRKASYNDDFNYVGSTSHY